MLIMFIAAALTVASILMATDYKTEWSRYLSGIIFMGALAGISDEINITLIPFLKGNMLVSSSTIGVIYRFHAFLTQFCEHIGIFLVVMYCISYSELLNKSKKRLATLSILTIAAVSFFGHPWLTSGEQNMRNLYNQYYTDLSLWGVPILIAGLIMLFAAYFKERNPGVIRQRFINLILATPLILSGVLNLLVLKAIGINNTDTNLRVMLAVIAFFIVFAVRSGAFGVRIRVGRQSVIGSIKTISEGTAIINRVLKDEAVKLSLGTGNIKGMLLQGNIDPVKYNDNMKLILDSISNLNGMVKEMQNFSVNIKLRESLCSVEDILNKAVSNISMLIKEKGIQLVKNYSYNIQIKCDTDYMVEAVTNILRNSCEALGPGKKINIDIYGNKKILNISINDNGPGIRKEYLSKVLKPFFTTKKGDRNFGFGLSYTYKVLNKHHGDLNVYSKENVGTTVTLSLPGYRIKSIDKNLPIRSR